MMLRLILFGVGVGLALPGGMWLFGKFQKWQEHFVDNLVTRVLDEQRVCTKFDTGVLHYAGGPGMPHRHTAHGVARVGSA